MAVLYTYENLDQPPSLGKLEKRVASSSINLQMIDNSYHHEEKWLKCWFNGDLSTEEKAILDEIVTGAVSSGRSWRHEEGSAFFELVNSGNRGWMYYRQRVQFRRPFTTVPSVTLSNIEFDGLANVEITKVTEKYFDYSVRTRTSRRTEEVTSITFDWEAQDD